MPIVYIQGVCGGSGGTTVAANLAAALQALGQNCLAFDLSHSNGLRLHAGLDPLERDGWARRLIRNENWFEAVYESASGCRVSPFGLLDIDESVQFDAQVSSLLPTLLAQLQQPFSPALDWIVVDAPAVQTASPAYQAVIAAFKAIAQLSIVVVCPEPRSYSLLVTHPQWASAVSDATVLLNAQHPERELSSDLAVVLRQEFQVAPLTINSDSAIPEAAAHLTNVLDHAPLSQACSDYKALALWVQASVRELTA